MIVHFWGENRCFFVDKNNLELYPQPLHNLFAGSVYCAFVVQDLPVESIAKGGGIRN
jgi:hypothetical protein